MLAKLVGAAQFSYCFLAKPAEDILGYEVKEAVERSQEEYWRLDVQRRDISRSRSESESMVTNDSKQTTTTAASAATVTTTTLSPSPTTTSVTGTTSTLYNFGPLKELNIIMDMSYSQYAAIGFPYPNTLTKIVMTILVPDQGHFRAGLDGLLWNRCPLLEVYEVHGTPTVELTWTPPITTNQEHEKMQRPLALQSLILNNTIFDQDSLENLLSFTPRLKVLKLIPCPREMPSQDTTGSDFFATSKWNLWALDTSPSLLKDLELRTSINSLTTLELFSKAQRPGVSCLLSELRGAPFFLHQILTTSDKLTHLRTLKTIVRLEDWDIHRRGGYFLLDDPRITLNNKGKNGNSPRIYGNDNIAMYAATAAATLYASEPTRAEPVIWRCRGLQTLHVEVHAPNKVMSRSPVQSRIIFGYISRVFPKLEELRVRTPHFCQTTNKIHEIKCPRIRLELEGGLCLLSRLKHLQRLDARPGNHASWILDNVREVDLDWMIPSGHTFKARRARQKEVKQWQQRCDQQKKLAAEQSPQKKAIGDVSAVTEVLGQLRNLGLLKDVKEMVKEMESMSVPSLQSLEGLSLRHSYFVWPENEIKNTVSS
ncbi:hypothetical protein BGZ89_010224 [Linnemannia elongata]|nr:hypothetical protein BGZ89_010224 [Linnemannia elongata]